MIKTTGAEFKRFYNDPEFWPPEAEYFHEGECVVLNGVEQEEFGCDFTELADDDALQVSHGVVYGDPKAETEIGSFEGYFRKWRRKQSFTFFTVEAPNEKVTAIKAAVKTAGGKVR